MRDPKILKKALFFAVLALFIDLLAFAIVIPIFPPVFYDETRGVINEIAPYNHRLLWYYLMIFAYALTQFISAPILGYLSDKIGRKPIFLLAIIVNMAGYVGLFFAVYLHSLTAFIVIRLLQGMVGGTLFVAQSIIADVSAKENKNKNFGLAGMSFGLAFIVGPAIGGTISKATDLAIPFALSAALCAINFVWFLIFFKETLVHKREDAKINIWSGFQNIAKAFTIPSLRVVFTVILLITFGFAFFTQSFQFFLDKTFQFDEKMVGYLFAYIGIWIAITQGIILRKITKKNSARKILKYTLFLLGGSFFLNLFPERWEWLLITVPLLAIPQGLSFPSSLTLISDSVNEKMQGEIIGINQSVSSIAQGFPPLIWAFMLLYIENENFIVRFPIIAGGTACLLAWVIYGTLYKRSIGK